MPPLNCFIMYVKKLSTRFNNVVDVSRGSILLKAVAQALFAVLLISDFILYRGFDDAGKGSTFHRASCRT